MISLPYAEYLACEDKWYVIVLKRQIKTPEDVSLRDFCLYGLAINAYDGRSWIIVPRNIIKTWEPKVASLSKLSFVYRRADANVSGCYYRLNLLRNAIHKSKNSREIIRARSLCICHVWFKPARKIGCWLVSNIFNLLVGWVLVQCFYRMFWAPLLLVGRKYGCPRSSPSLERSWLSRVQIIWALEGLF